MEFRTTKPKVNFASVQVVIQDQSDARYKQSGEGKKGKEEGGQPE
jgi:hypothetical protein